MNLAKKSSVAERWKLVRKRSSKENRNANTCLKRPKRQNYDFTKGSENFLNYLHEKYEESNVFALSLRLNRFYKYSHGDMYSAGMRCLMMADMYVEMLKFINKSSPKCFETGILVATKLTEDRFMNNKIWSEKIINRPQDDINSEERTFLEKIQFRVHITREQYNARKSFIEATL